jgi:hypothetical protein
MEIGPMFLPGGRFRGATPRIPRSAGRARARPVGRAGLPRSGLVQGQLCPARHNWPRARYLELAPRYWNATRARLDPNELDQELGPLKVPEAPLPTATAAPVPDELSPAP